MRKPSAALIISLLALFVALGGVGVAATGGNFILGKSNSADATSALSAPVAAGKALQLSNTNTTSGSTALGLNVASGHAPLTVNSLAGKATNLNADKLDGIDSTGLISTSTLRRVGPVTTTFNVAPVTYATVGPFSFFGHCDRNGSGNELVAMTLGTSAAHSTFASLTQTAAGGDEGTGDMEGTGSYALAGTSFLPPGTHDFNSVSGIAIAPNSQTVFFNVYQGMNVRNQPGKCIFGGSFLVN